jgi:hypothetical protein
VWRGEVTTSGTVSLARWRSVGSGGYPVVNDDRIDVVRLKEGKKGLGWPQIGEENGLGRGSRARDG